MLQKAFTCTLTMVCSEFNVENSAVQSNVKRLQGIEIGKVPFASVAAAAPGHVESTHLPAAQIFDAYFAFVECIYEK